MFKECNRHKSLYMDSYGKEASFWTSLHNSVNCIRWSFNLKFSVTKSFVLELNWQVINPIGHVFLHIASQNPWNPSFYKAIFTKMSFCEINCKPLKEKNVKNSTHQRLPVIIGDCALSFATRDTFRRRYRLAHVMKQFERYYLRRGKIQLSILVLGYDYYEITKITTTPTKKATTKMAKKMRTQIVINSES